MKAFAPAALLIFGLWPPTSMAQTPTSFPADTTVLPYTRETKVWPALDGLAVLPAEAQAVLEQLHALETSPVVQAILSPEQLAFLHGVVRVTEAYIAATKVPYGPGWVAGFFACATRDGVPASPQCLAAFGRDGDKDVDMNDFAYFQRMTSAASCPPCPATQPCPDVKMLTCAQLATTPVQMTWAVQIPMDEDLKGYVNDSLRRAYYVQLARNAVKAGQPPPPLSACPVCPQ